MRITTSLILHLVSVIVTKAWKIQVIFQLRVSLSPLRGHKWRHNFTDTPSGICHCKQGMEDTSHFSIESEFKSLKRSQMASQLH